MKPWHVCKEGPTDYPDHAGTFLSEREAEQERDRRNKDLPWKPWHVVRAPEDWRPMGFTYH